jgi:hypothetical protein
MATVTGFTAERMLVIENETVIDGEVQGDNLILQQRGGTQIDAGNVRGPKGDKGDTGLPGEDGLIDSVNDDSSPHVYAPRMFADRASIDVQWPSAPRGAVAVVHDGSDTIWQKDSIGWVIVNGIRIFASTTERDSRWLNPPDGSVCQAPPGIEHRRINGVWTPWPTIHKLSWSNRPASVAASTYVNFGLPPANPYFHANTTDYNGYTHIIIDKLAHYEFSASSQLAVGLSGGSLCFSDVVGGNPGGKYGGNMQCSQIGGGQNAAGMMICATFNPGASIWASCRQGPAAGGINNFLSVDYYDVGSLV